MLLNAKKKGANSPFSVENHSSEAHFLLKCKEKRGEFSIFG
jgi:hypothetical protein